ncbi:hypothetical protein ACCC97_10650 [Variovorax sp. Varisp85]|uniref:hypothetical protein n=1 Tax=Variovorax sp. Varisp85 TaxID=3243059 RepID=UPI0039A5F625
MSGPSQLWSREIPWRQGHVLPADAIVALGLAHLEAEQTCVVVISHDCDLASDNLDAEPDVEVIIGRLVNKGGGNFTWGKSPRTLHIDMLQGEQAVSIELVSTGKAIVPKEELAKFVPDSSYSLSPQGLSTLRSWLAARYNRAAFPDAFVDRMKATKVEERLAKAIEPHGSLISFVYFDIDGGAELNHSDGTPYVLSIVLVYPPGDDADAAADAADAVAAAVEASCNGRLVKEGKQSQDIVLKQCIAISEDDISISQAKLLMHWRLEHLSSRATDAQPTPVVL